MMGLARSEEDYMEAIFFFSVFRVSKMVYCDSILQ